MFKKGSIFNKLEVVNFFVNYQVQKGVVMSRIGEEELRLNDKTLGKIMGIPNK